MNLESEEVQLAKTEICIVIEYILISYIYISIYHIIYISFLHQLPPLFCCFDRINQYGDSVIKMEKNKIKFNK